ncbi:hypothetical protein AVEN_19514-1 [Araneus ventricosus]|uniref:Uncharacterized protein n=1 Tax=Araneus ventricosus TaxID=182803 RepID=A0A4Y2QCT5_ARAVE|nr:hypothetical protein AVEN_19514-1 [Araneus ventricosus]
MKHNKEINTDIIIYSFLSDERIIQSRRPCRSLGHTVHLKDWSPRQQIGQYGPRIAASITRGSCDDPSFYRDTTRLRRWVRRATAALLYPTRKGNSA